MGSGDAITCEYRLPLPVSLVFEITGFYFSIAYTKSLANE